MDTQCCAQSGEVLGMGKSRNLLVYICAVLFKGSAGLFVRVVAGLLIGALIVGFGILGVLLFEKTEQYW